MAKLHSLVLAAAWLLMNTILVLGSPVGDCPPVDPLDHTDHLPDDKNCSLFYKCDHAAPVLFACPDGLHFNRLLEVCDWPDAAGCTGSHGSTSPAAPTDSPNTGSTSASTSTDKPAGDESNTAIPAKECPDIGSCTQYEDEKSIAKHLPHATNCSQFCKCDHGKPVTFDCPAGLHFNAILEVCDWPQNAGCSAKPSTEAPATTTKPTTAAPITTGQPMKPTTALPSTTAVDTTASPSTTVNPTTSAPASSSTAEPSPPATSDPSRACPAVGVCPQYEDEKSIAKHLPHASNCSQFCKCDHGKPVTFDCPAGLHFNAILEVCDWPQNAGCSSKPTTAAPVTTTAVPTSTAKPTTTVPTTTDKPTTSAPTTSAKPTTSVPVTTSTAAEATTAAPTTVKSTTSSTVSSPTEAASSLPTSDASGNCPAVGSCPQYDDEKSIAKHLPHASNCSQFCKCDHGKPVTFDCPSGLHFNAILEVCDWPESAGCSTKPTTAAPNTSAEPPTIAPNTTVEPTTATPSTSAKPSTAAPSSTVKPSTAVPSTTVVPTSSAPSLTVEPCDAVGSCPVHDEHSIVKHLPHRTNCGLYCRCNHGVPITEKCPEGLHFNAMLEVCDWPSAAGCQ